MINYAKHDEDFYGIFKLTNGDEIIGKAVLHNEEGESICFIQDPLSVEVFTRHVEEGKVAKGIGLAPWMQMSDEEFIIVREKDIVALATMSKQHVMLYETFLRQEFGKFQYALMTMNSKDVKISVGPCVNLNNLTVKRVKRKSVQLVRRTKK